MASLTDLTFLQSFTGGNKEKIVKYINLFLNACPDQLNKMKERLAERDYSGLRSAAHTLKPQVIYMGMKNGEELVKRIENMAGEERDVDQLPTLVNEFEQMCNAAMDELRQAI